MSVGELIVCVFVAGYDRWTAMLWNAIGQEKIYPTNKNICQYYKPYATQSCAAVAVYIIFPSHCKVVF